MRRSISCAALILFLFVGNCSADFVYEFVVWVASFSDTVLLRAQGRLNDRQPINNESLLTMPNTNYMLLTINPNGPVQRQWLLDRESEGKIMLTKSIKIYGVSNEQGSWQAVDPPRIFNPYPMEMFKVWGSTW